MRTRLHTPALPPVTDEHRRRAYASLGIAHRFPTFEAALTSDTHRRVIEAYAHQLRTRDAMVLQARTLPPQRRWLQHCPAQPDLLESVAHV